MVSWHYEIETAGTAESSRNEIHRNIFFSIQFHFYIQIRFCGVEGPLEAVSKLIWAPFFNLATSKRDLNFWFFLGFFFFYGPPLYSRHSWRRRRKAGKKIISISFYKLFFFLKKNPPGLVLLSFTEFFVSVHGMKEVSEFDKLLIGYQWFWWDLCNENGFFLALAGFWWV